MDIRGFQCRFSSNVTSPGRIDIYSFYYRFSIIIILFEEDIRGFYNRFLIVFIPLEEGWILGAFNVDSQL